MAESEEELKSLLMNVKEESEKGGLKLNIQKTKIMASGRSHHVMANRRGKSGSSERFSFIGLQNTTLQTVTTAMKLKRYLLLGRKAMTNLDNILKSKDITLPTKIHIVKVTVFPVVMYRYKSWIIKKDVCLRIDAFELWCWRRLLRVPWTARRSSQSI